MSGIDVEVGVAGYPYRDSKVAIGSVMQAEADGAQGVWFPDSLMGWHPRELWHDDAGLLAKMLPDPHAFADPFVSATAALMATRKITIGIGVTDTYRRHPVTITQAAVTLAEMAPDRFVLGLGTGEGLNTNPIGIDRQRPISRLREALELMHALLETDGLVSYSGDVFHADRVPGMASTGARPEIVLGGHSPALLELVGRFGTGWLPVIPTTPARYAERLDVAHAAAREHGRAPNDIVAGLYVYALIHEDGDVARAALDATLVRTVALAGNRELFGLAGLDHPLGREFSGLRDYIPEHLGAARIREALASFGANNATNVFVCGSPKEVVSRLRDFARVGARRFVLDNLVPLAFPDEFAAARRATADTVRIARLELSTMGEQN